MSEELKKAKIYALRVVNFRPRSAKELTNKLKEKNFSDNIIAEVISEFKKKGFLNDAKFSRLWINSRMASKPKGEALLKRELMEKGVTNDVINEVIEEAKSEYSEYEIVKNLADQRMERLRDLDKRTAKRRLFGFLKRRGFNFETIMKVLNEVVP
ncbi:MAG: recombination regulator RecX [Candidatus Omnitrophica bacterium]|nr:recombination regulator RecX [Candidatus Omnitrophota bacterium]